MLSNSSTFHLRKPQIPVFKGHSYEHWSIKMKTLFMAEGLWDIVESNMQESYGKVHPKEYQRKDAKALLYIQQAVDESIFSRIATATSAKQAWSFIKTDYQESNKMSRLTWFQDANIDVELPENLIEERTQQPSVCMVPRIIRDCTPSSYAPRMVSIGPLHRNNENLQPNEEKKAIYAFSLLTRVGETTQKETLQACARKVYASVNKIRSCYDVEIIYNNIELTKMMVMDGCFILELLYSFLITKDGDDMFMELAGDDLLLLENQIPFFVLEDIFECTASKFQQKTSLINLIKPLLGFAKVFRGRKIRISLDSNTHHHHILGLLHKCYKFQNGESSKDAETSRTKEFQNAEISHTIELQDDNSSHTEEFQEFQSDSVHTEYLQDDKSSHAKEFRNAESSHVVEFQDDESSHAKEFQNAESSNVIGFQDDSSSHSDEFQNAESPNSMLFQGNESLSHDVEEFQDGIELESDESVGYVEGKLSSAVELDRAGVKFKPSRDAEWPYMIKVISSRSTCFPCSWGRPTLIMPALKISSSTEFILRNLIAYEQLIGPETNYVITQYVGFMDKLIDTGEDIAMLVESKVIFNNIGSDEEAAGMINNICKYIVGNEEPFYQREWLELSRHCNKSWPKNMAWLRLTYFNNPWNIIALLAGMALFVLTLLQTIFTIMSSS